MEIAAIIVVTFTGIQFIIALINFLSVNTVCSVGQTNSMVSVLIPARNEEEHIGFLLEDLRLITNTEIEILIYNDQSEDHTADVISRAMEMDDRVRLLRTEPLPDGWLGKNWGCHQLAQEAKGDYLLFLDADVRIHGKLIIHSMEWMRQRRVDLLSIFPHQIMVSLGEKISVPLMNLVLLTLLPVRLVEESHFASLAAANGQFMLFRGERYREIRPHQILRHSKVEDIGIARLYKKLGLKVSCRVGIPEIQCRMYHSWREAVKGFSKNFPAFFGGSLLLGALFWLITTLGFFFVFSQSMSLFLVYILLYVATLFFVARISGHSFSQQILLWLPQQITMGLLLVYCFKNRITKNDTWKGRKIES